VDPLKPIRDYVEALLHPSVQHDALAAARHRAFIAPRLIGSVVALALLPLYVTLRGAPGAIEVLVFAWLIVPMLCAFYLARTGEFERAHVLSALGLTAMVTMVAAGTGGIASFAAVWLVVVPLEAALSGSRRVVIGASIGALAAAGFLLALSGGGLLPDAANNPLLALGIISAALYVASLSVGMQSLLRTVARLRAADEQRYRLMARNATDIITRHGRGGAVLFVSPAAEALFGTHTGELLGHRLFERINVGDRPAYLKALADAASLNETRRNETRHVALRIRRDGSSNGHEPSFVWVDMQCRPLDSAAAPGPDREVVAVMRDATERMQNEQAVETMRAQADRSEIAKRHFLATVSHELRTPLNAIIGFSDMLVQDERLRLDDERRRDYARLINDSGSHLLSVVNDILDMSKMETGEFTIMPESFAPAPVIRNCCDLLELKARDGGIELELALDPGLSDIVADKRAFRQIMLNLLSNAVKFTDRGGRVTVAARVESSGMVVSVKDNGIGIGVDDLPRVGSPFFQARAAYDRPHDGTGLGLSIVKGLVLLHGGTVDIQSRLGEGTCINVRLPLDCEQRRSAPLEATVTHPVFDRGVLSAPMVVSDGVEEKKQVKKRA